MIEQESLDEEPLQRIEHYNPVTVSLSESTGVVAVTIVALILLLALLRSQRRIRELQGQQRGQQEDSRQDSVP